MFDNLGSALIMAGIIYANVYVGLPFLVLLWTIGWLSQSDGVDRGFLRGRMLFTCSVLLNAIWKLLEYFPDTWYYKEPLYWIEQRAEIPVLVFPFVCLCGSIFMSYRSRWSGKIVLFIGQGLLLLFSSVCWFLVLRASL